mmetsp:Transcript_6825/g.17840  ORF Transcript_6825/g.17840 Transcript_6825/m.17840 type:complete len:373 (+) Transcript_6825:152-1270(+)|eukprot:jgi/Tetstr1/462789/TSEL_007740.t1
MDIPDQTKGVALAVSSSLFIGASFIIKKKGLKIASANGVRAGSGGYAYLKEPMWWTGMVTMILGEFANFAAYAFAPAIVVTPLGALSIIISAILAHLILSEKLNMFGVLGCILCITGSVTIVLHAPAERPIESVREISHLALQPGFLMYLLVALCTVFFLIFYVSPKYGSTHIFCYIGICSLVGSLSVMSCKALGIAIKLTIEGDNQFVYPEIYYCLVVVILCVVTQMNYLNKALDIFNTAIVSPIYYVMFTIATILASLILFQDVQSWTQIATEFCGFVTVVGGTFLLHTTKDMDFTFQNLSALTRSGAITPKSTLGQVSRRGSNENLQQLEMLVQSNGNGYSDGRAGQPHQGDRWSQQPWPTATPDKVTH